MMRRHHDAARRWRRAEAAAGSAGDTVDDWRRLLARHGCIAPGATARELWPDRGRLVEHLAADSVTRALVANDLAGAEVAGP